MRYKLISVCTKKSLEKMNCAANLFKIKFPKTSLNKVILDDYSSTIQCKNIRTV